ncbi:MAG: type 3 dihydrofolate reductase [Spongiibacteraceae bacterium]
MTAKHDVAIAMIVAMAENRVIGRNNQLPWYLPNDLKYFKATTMGKPVVMGRKTFESIGRPLPGRSNIVVTNNPGFIATGVEVVHSVEEAINLARSIALVDGVDEVMVIGGAQLYKEMLPKTSRLYFTQVHAEIEGDALFPELDNRQWREVSRENFQAVKPNPFDYSFVVFDRIQ